MNNSLTLKVVAFVLALLSSALSWAGEPVVLTADTQRVPVGLYLEILEDPMGELTLDQVRSSALAERWIPNQVEVPNFSFSDSVYWLHFSVVADQGVPPDWYVEVAFPMQDYIDVYVVYGSEGVQHYEVGDRRSFSDRPVKHRNFLFPVQALRERQNIYIKVRSHDGLHESLPVSLVERDVFWEQDQVSSWGLGIYYGLMGVMVIYNIFIYFSVRESAYLHYVLYIFFYISWGLTFNGFTAQFFPSGDPNIYNLLLGMVINLSTAFAALFTINYLQTPKNLPRITKVLRVLAAISIFNAIAVFFIPYSLSFTISPIVWIMMAISFIAAGALRTYQGYNPARYYLVGWIMFMLGAIFISLKVMGLIPSNIFTQNTFQVGSALEVILLSLGLADKINQEKKGRELAQREALDNHLIALESQKISMENLKRMDKLKDEFLANTSHELRTPLNGIIGLAEACLHDPQESPGSRQRENLDMIVASGRRLGSLVNDILDFSKLRHEDIVLSPRAVDTRAIANMVLRLSKPLLNGRDISLVNEIREHLPLVWADENRLQQIFHNLLGNALKFTEQGSVTLNAVADEDWLTVIVKDTGIGIADDRIDSIFESFNQGDGSIQRDYGGTGLGLSITRKLVQLHGGQITVKSKESGGSTFSFTLPLAKEDQDVPDQPVLSEEDLPVNAEDFDRDAIAQQAAQVQIDTDAHASDRSISQWILVVDDEPINRQVLKAQLGSAGFGVVEAGNGVEALERLRSNEHRFDLVLLDVMMPKLSGFDTCSQLRKGSPHLVLPVIFLTAKSQTEDVLAGFEAGGNDYLIKPFSRDELLARIRIHLELVTTYKIIGDYSKNLEKTVEQRTKALAHSQKQLALKQKMAALGTLTAGVAHEINNPVNFIRAASENASAWNNAFREFIGLLLDEEADSEITEIFENKLGKLDEQLDLIQEGTARIESIVNGLKAVTHLNETEKKETDVIAGLEETVKLLRPTIANKAQINMTAQPGVEIECWGAELNQVFMNVVMNAVHGIEDKKRTQTFDGLIEISSEATDRLLTIHIKDNGCGMSEDVVDQACDPFFTTREVGSGSGLGLSISLDIVKKHDGDIALESTPGEGTTVSITLPLG